MRFAPAARATGSPSLRARALGSRPSPWARMWVRPRAPRSPSTRWRKPPRSRRRTDLSFVSSRARLVVDDEHLGQPHAVVVADDDGFAARDQAAVHVDVERLAAHLVELEHRARSEAKNVGDF